MAGENYRRIVPTFWTDPDVKSALSVQDKLLLLYFFTSPHSNMIGLYYCPLEYAAAELGIPVRTIAQALDGPLAPFVSRDPQTEEILVRRAAFHQMGNLAGGDKRKEGVRKLLEAAHSRSLRRQFLAEYRGWELGVTVPADPKPSKKPLPGRGKAPSKGHGKGLTKGLPDGGEAPTQAIAVTDAGTGAGTEKQIPADAGEPVPVREFTEILSRIGEYPPGRVGAATKPVVSRYGADRTRDMLTAFVEFGPHMDRTGQANPEVNAPQYCTPEKFRDNAKFWHDYTQPISANGAH